MNKFFLKLQGYKKIDEVIGFWDLGFTDLEGRIIAVPEKSLYSIFYNPTKDKYRIEIDGIYPYAHFMYKELNSIIDFVNAKPINSGTNFTRTSQDYFIQKEALMELIYGTDDIIDTNILMHSGNNNISILRMELEHYKEYLKDIRKSDPELKDAMQKYRKEVIDKREVEVYEDLGNVIVTSEGCFFSTYEVEKFNIRDDEDEKGIQ